MLGGKALLSPGWFIHAQNLQDFAPSSNKDMLRTCKLWLRKMHISHRRCILALLHHFLSLCASPSLDSLPLSHIATSP